MFGQAIETELQKAFKPQLAPKSDTPALIDVVEPFQPLDPADAPKGDQAPGPVGGWHTHEFLAVRGGFRDRGIKRRALPTCLA